MALAPGFGEFYNLLAVAYLDRGRLPDAVTVLDEVLSQEQSAEDHAMALYLWGVAYREMERHPEAIASLEESLRAGDSAVVVAEGNLPLPAMRGGAGDSALAH